MTDSDRPAPEPQGRPDETTTRARAAAIVLAVLPLRDIVVFPHMIVPLFVGREKSVRALEAVMKDDKQILLVAQKNAAQDDPSADDIYPCRHGLDDPAIAEAARRHGEGAGGGRQAREDHRLPRHRQLFRGVRRGDARSGRRRQGARGARPHGGFAVRAVHQAEQEDRARGAGLAQPDRGAVEACRYRGEPSQPEDRREAGAAGDRQGRRAAGARVRTHGVRDRRAAGGEAHPQPRQAADGEDAARVLPERAAQGDPEGAGRGRGRQGRERRTRGAHQEDQASPRKRARRPCRS